MCEPLHHGATPGLFSVTRGLDRSKHSRPFKSYLDMVCSLVHGPRKSLHVDFGRNSPLPQGPLATFPRIGDHNLPSSLGQEGPPSSICPQVIPPPPTYTHSLPSSRFMSGPGQTGRAEGKMAFHELLSPLSWTMASMAHTVLPFNHLYKLSSKRK